MDKGQTVIQNSLSVMSPDEMPGLYCAFDLSPALNDWEMVAQIALWDFCVITQFSVRSECPKFLCVIVCPCFSGLIGRSWAMVFASGGYSVKIYDNQPGQAVNAIAEIRSAAVHNTTLFVQHNVKNSSIVLINVIFNPLVQLSFLFWVGCGWGGRVVVLQPEGRQFNPQSSQRKTASKVSLSKLLNPELPLIELIDALYECVCDWVNEKLYCKVLWVVIKTRKVLNKYKSILPSISSCCHGPVKNPKHLTSQKKTYNVNESILQ